MHTDLGTRLAVDKGQGWHAPATKLSVLTPDLLAGTAEWSATVGTPVSAPLGYAAPVRPGKIIAIGLNYADHVRETGMETPSEPLMFAKFPSCVIGDGDEIVIPTELTERVDWEVELAVVIGRTARHVRAEEALEYVFGYTVANDVSARDLQFRDGQWTRGKNLDTFCPLGPVVVTPDELPDPQQLAMRTLVNGEVVQDSNTSEMIFTVADIIAHVSAAMTLHPGDVLLTGTPWGCGEFMTPRRSLADGDVVTVEIADIGRLTNVVTATAGRHA